MVDNADGKGPLGRSGVRWEVKIKLDHKEIRWEDMDLIDWLRIGTSVRLL